MPDPPLLGGVNGGTSLHTAGLCPASPSSGFLCSLQGVKHTCANRAVAMPGSLVAHARCQPGAPGTPAQVSAPPWPPITAIGTNQTPGGTKDVKNKVKNTHTRTLAPLSWSPPMSNVSTPPGKGGADLK